MKVALFTLLCVPAAAFSPELSSATELDSSATELGSAASSEEKLPQPKTHEEFTRESQYLFSSIEENARLFWKQAKYIIRPLPSCQCFLCNDNEINDGGYCSAKQSEAGQDCFGNKDLPGCYSSLDSYNCHCKIGTTDLLDDEIAQIDLPKESSIKYFIKRMNSYRTGPIKTAAINFEVMAENLFAEDDWKEVVQLADIQDYRKALRDVTKEGIKVFHTIQEKQSKAATLKAMQVMKGVMQQAVEVCKKMLKVNEYFQRFGNPLDKASIMQKCPEI